MRITTVTYGRTKSANYQSKQVSATVEVDADRGETASVAIELARLFVEEQLDEQPKGTASAFLARHEAALNEDRPPPAHPPAAAPPLNRPRRGPPVG